MELTPLAPRRNQGEARQRAHLQGLIFTLLAHAGVQIRERVFRTIQTNALDNLYQNLRAAGDQGAVRLAEIYRQFTGQQVDNFEQLLGMRRIHRWGQSTAPPESYANKEALRKRIQNFEKTVKQFKASNPRKVDAIAEREGQLQRWKDYYNDQFGTDTPPETPNEEPNEIAGPGGVVRPRTPDAPERNVRPALENNRVQEEPQLQAPEAIDIDQEDEFLFDSQQLRQIDEAVAAQGGLGEMANQQAAIGGGGPSMQNPGIRIKKEKPLRSEDGTSVTFRGTRLMYTWGYNFSEQKNPFAQNKQIAYNAPGSQVLKPLGHTLPWDMISFYCTPAEWESLDWKTHKIEIEYVKVIVTPADKSVFFTTGSSQTTPVSTEHAAYVYKIENMPSNIGLLRCQPRDGSLAINWATNDLLMPANYYRLRDRLWGPRERESKGYSCMDGVKRELELVSCMLLDDNTLTSDFGSTTVIGESQVVEPLNAVMGKPYITKTYYPKCGLVNDPSTKVLMNRFSDTTGGTNQTTAGVTTQVAPFRQKKMYEDMLHEAAILAHKDHSFTYLKYAGAAAAFGAQHSFHFPIHGGPNTSRLQNTTFAAYPATASAASLTTGTAATNRFANVGDISTSTSRLYQGDANGAVTNGTSSVLISTKLNDTNKGLQWANIYLDDRTVNTAASIPSGSVLIGNKTPVSGDPVSGKPQVGLQAFQSTSEPQVTYTDWSQSLDLDKDIGVNYGDTDTFYLQQWHSKIEKGNSFIPMGADRDNFPRVVEEQPTFCFGIKPVIATDPNNAGSVDYLKAQVNWQIYYEMKIKQTYIQPELRFVEKRSVKNAGDTRLGPFVLPDKTDYSHDIRPYGLQVGVRAIGNYTDNNTAKTCAFNISEQNPLERDLTFNNRVFQTIKTAPVYHPQDFETFPASVQTKMCNTPMVLSEVKYS